MVAGGGARVNAEGASGAGASDAGASSAGDRGQLFASARVGAAFADLFTRLGPSYVVAVEAGWILPRTRQRVALSLDGGFTAPEATGGASDASVGVSS